MTYVVIDTLYFQENLLNIYIYSTFYFIFRTHIINSSLVTWCLTFSWTSDRIYFWIILLISYLIMSIHLLNSKYEWLHYFSKLLGKFLYLLLKHNSLKRVLIKFDEFNLVFNLDELIKTLNYIRYKFYCTFSSEYKLGHNLDDITDFFIICY